MNECILVYSLYCIVCTVFFIVFRLRIFILICFVCKDYCHRVTTQLQLVVVVVVVVNLRSKKFE